MLLINVDKDRLYSETAFVFLLWMIFASIILLIVSYFLMSKQIRPLKRLSIIAETFGRGLDAPELQSAGASEIRQTANAFNQMRTRIKRFLKQRTDMLAGVSHDLRTPLTRMKLQLSLLKDKKAKKVIVAIIDSGVQTDHPFLSPFIWVNSDEIPNNQIDDDNNGYVDDVNGWNFLGESSNEQLEYVRLLASKDETNPRYEEAKKLHEKEVKKYGNSRQRYKGISDRIKKANKAILEYTKKESYTKEDVLAMDVEDDSLMAQVKVIKQAYGFGVDSMSELTNELDSYVKSLSERLDYYLNVDFDGRAVVGDDPDDLEDRDYGDNNVMPKNGSSHGTHVSGIIAGVRNNGIGMNGAADKV